MDPNRGILLVPLFGEFDYKVYEQKINDYFKNVNKFDPDKRNVLCDMFWSCVENGGYWNGEFSLLCDELEIFVDDINTHILQDEGRLNDMNFKLKVTWRRYLQGLFTRKSLPFNGFLDYPRNLYCPTPEYRTLMKKIAKFSKPAEMQKIEPSSDLLEVWATFAREYEMIFGILEKFSIFIGKQFDDKVSSLQEAFQIYKTGDRTPQEKHVLEILQNVQHLRNAIKHEHVNLDNPDKILIWDEFKGTKNWEREFTREGLPNLYVIIYQMNLLVQGIRMAALVVRTAWKAIIGHKINELCIQAPS